MEDAAVLNTIQSVPVRMVSIITENRRIMIRIYVFLHILVEVPLCEFREGLGDLGVFGQEEFDTGLG
jgi:hypothetical protein